jgi:hypothetical protein
MISILFKVIIIIAAIIGSARLWHMGGQGKKWARSFALPCVIALAKLLITFNAWTLLYAPILMGMIALFSYGINAPPHKFWVKVFKGKGADGNYMPVEIATRATCGFFWSLAGIAFAWITGHWIHQIIYTVFLMVANSFWGMVKEVEISEPGAGASVATVLGV